MLVLAVLATPSHAASRAAAPATFKPIGAAADAELDPIKGSGSTSNTTGCTTAAALSLQDRGRRDGHKDRRSLLFLHPWAAVLALLLAACLEPLLRGQVKNVEGRSHAAISVPLLSSACALRVGFVTLFFLKGVCGNPAAPLQIVNVSSPCSLTDGGSLPEDRAQLLSDVIAGRVTLSSRNDFAWLLAAVDVRGAAVEVGVADGEFSSMVLAGWRGCTQYTQVDPWFDKVTAAQRFGKNAKLVTMTDQSHLGSQLCSVRTHFRHARYSGKVRQLRMLSADAAAHITDSSLAFVYIDGDHYFRGVQEDLRMYWPKLRPGGLIAGHDFEWPWLTNGVAPASICMLTMIGPAVAKKYASQVASQRCYAGRHGYRIFAQWWVIYFDADVYLVNHERPLSEWLDDASELVMTDHHQIMNNGAIFVRRTPRMLEFLLPLWIKLTMAYTWSCTDNGSLMEVIARGYALGPGGNSSCPRRPANVAFPCYQSVFTKAFGPVPGRGGSRGRAGLKLVAPADGFNNHGCMSPVVDCSSPVARKLMASRYQREWTLDDVFVPPKIRKRQGLPPMFGLHSKASNPFPDRAMRSILQPANVTHDYPA
ncbi:hypothetical protein EMIHUDRAFT_201823 [Emiliania huxleyi CCMP1516]|uniref:Methyltransferase domain-containing protein n=2 Tax=Emiliania huxleyi TaxID=2903 RepID=A0A0D3KEK0_EMIH1|nr:hypothetical protein EMIHUDRAFT_201823 [Emiliania huxleyi CCMP1516]EOD34185.1 hypothetical protein EMIHUDRAFT_201823 [Emiliania huxleyi CCMP1516]|eukprot:XP_005786614.1 hypothetical protein EMIHUDRAFT_201823 [Emiliania huxleyi CCMP1516]